MFFGLPKISISSWTDMETKFIMQYMGELQLLKYVYFLDDVHQGETESLASCYRYFNKNLTKIN